ncbi:MAG: radical SAM family heme chaperone HemW [Candidatus Neomarinimicrobiota bacterium]|nr:radical SAM family heme chaperone HemW [Candidatus Neomarinimicrobiota bacterium]
MKDTHTKTSKTKAGIYIHIPFCKIKCMYCDFYSITEREKDVNNFVEALCTEISRSPLDGYPWIFNTLFIGGGTPSLLNGNQLESILTTLSKKISFSNLIEKTIEINPGEASLEILTDFRSLGVNRVSMGVQSLEEELLTFLTRSHSVNQVFETFDHARTAGFNNINCDLIYGIPTQTPDIWKRDMNQIIELGAEHISAYSLTVEKGTELFHMVNSNKVTMPGESISADWFTLTRSYLSQHQYIPYEISNFSKPEKECWHNLHYWNIDPYIGFGPSAHSFDGEKRWNNVRSLDQYTKKMEAELSPVSSTEVLTTTQKLNERIGFGLRLIGGIDLEKFSETQKKQFNQNMKKHRNKWDDYIEKDGKKIKLQERGFAFADAIAVDLLI